MTQPPTQPPTRGSVTGLRWETSESGGWLIPPSMRQPATPPAAGETSTAARTAERPVT
ncbi:hypothetical protein [Tenggerimyces flavus]|uniref:Uncharacterized protein n=1 Tax=Tenggerimyces flavus TaxID=1708749 RepID=A0ABV7Y996_9ACTN|nr:hypothetical protein [Tenggerimyces flavus]MBM7785657.1 hypothetical protein [Tenggerimyces flavus]